MGEHKEESHGEAEGAGGALDALFWVILVLAVIGLLFSFFSGFGIDTSKWPSLTSIFELIFTKIQVFSVFLILLFFSVAIYLNTKVSEMIHSQFGHGHEVHGHDSGGHDSHAHKSHTEAKPVEFNIENHGPNKRWVKIEERMSSQNEQDWKIAIVDADIVLEEMLTRMGYEGEGIAEKLKQVDKADFHTVQNAWNAHKVRNRIAHEGSDFHLSRTEAEIAIENFKKVFQEFYFI